jgi:hypothetical protein
MVYAVELGPTAYAKIRRIEESKKILSNYAALSSRSGRPAFKNHNRRQGEREEAVRTNTGWRDAGSGRRHE